MVAYFGIKRLPSVDVKADRTNRHYKKYMLVETVELIWVNVSARRTQSSRSCRCPRWVCAVERRRFPVGARPTRRPLQPEATGAVMEETKWLKPSVSVSRIGDSASVQAVTRVDRKSV